MDFKTGRGKTPIPPIYRKNWQRREDVCVKHSRVKKTN